MWRPSAAIVLFAMCVMAKEALHLHGENHPPATIAMSATPLVSHDRRSSSHQRGRMQLKFYLTGAIQGFTYRAVVALLDDVTGDVRRQESTEFALDGPDSEEVTFDFTIPDLQQDRFRFDISVFDAYPGLTTDEALIAHRDIREDLSYDYSYLHREIRAMSCHYRTASAWLGPLDNVPVELVTLVTQCSVDRLDRLREQALAFGNNPLSVAVYVPSSREEGVKREVGENTEASDGDDDILSDLRQLHAELAASGTRRVTISVLFGKAPSSVDYDNLYPINNLRNLALDAATTDLVLLVDVDYVPSPELALLCSASNSTPYETYRDMCQRGHVLSVVAFEVRRGTRELPKTRQELEVLWHQQGRWASRSHLEVFHFTDFPNRHLPSNFEQWFTAEEPYEVEYHGRRIIDYASYARHISMFEPYAIAWRADVPRYDERFRGYGLNKISHAHEWIAAGALFRILPRVFFTARDHAPSEVCERMWVSKDRDPEHEQRISLIWSDFRRQLGEKYGVVVREGEERDGSSAASCTDDPSFDVGNGGCKTYSFGVSSEEAGTCGINDFACQEDGACAACCASCAHAIECQDTVSIT